MKHLLLTTIAAVLVVGCGESQQSAPSQDIWTAASEGNIEAVKQHIAAGADVNAKDDLNRRTPLHYATSDGRKEIAELLITNGADVNAKAGKNGQTPLDINLGLSRAYERKVQSGVVSEAWKKRVPEGFADLLRKHGGKTSPELKAEGK